MFLINGYYLDSGVEKINGTVKIIFDDIKSEFNYWINVMVCYVLGVNLLC